MIGLKLTNSFLNKLQKCRAIGDVTEITVNQSIAIPKAEISA
jgi:hypothetical protein